MATKYNCRLTEVGSQLAAKAYSLGVKIYLDLVSVGDGGGDEAQEPTPTGKETALLGEKWRGGIASKEVDSANKNILWVKGVIPADVGDFWVREFGIWAQNINDDGSLDPDTHILFAYGNHGSYYKTLPKSGQSVSHMITVPAVVSDVDTVEIVISDAAYSLQSDLFATNKFINTIRVMYQFETTAENAIYPGTGFDFPDNPSTGTAYEYPIGKKSLVLTADGCTLTEGIDYAEATGKTTATSVTVLKYLPAGTSIHGIIHGFTTSADLPVSIDR